MKILLVDDDNDKIVRLIKVVRDVAATCEIEVVEDFVSCMRNLKSGSYDLLVVDLLLPVRKGEEPSFDVSRNLLREIERARSVVPPRWILGISQHIEPGFSISPIWPTVKYDPKVNSWAEVVSAYLRHISRFCENTVGPGIARPRIFVEGLSDKLIIELAFRLFQPDLSDSVEICGEKNAGSSWVSRQLIVWAHSLNKDSDGKYVRAVGLLDGDTAGNDAKKEINRVILGDSAHALTNKVFTLSIGYARHLIPLKEKGLLIPVCLEEMYSPEAWAYAVTRKFVELRTRPEQLLRDKSSWNGYEISLKDYLNTLGLTEEQKLYLNVPSIGHKEDFTEYILGLTEGEQRKVLFSFENLVNEICNYIFDRI